MQPFKSVSYTAVAPGTRLIVLGAVHGNETCGTRAIERVIAEIDAGSLRLERRPRHLRAGDQSARLRRTSAAPATATSTAS